MPRLGISLLMACLFASLPGCTPREPATTDPSNESTEPSWFEETTARSGVQFRHQAGLTGRYFLPQVMGSGVAVLDVDNDGRFDLLFLTNTTQGGSTHQLYRQLADGTFRNATAGSGLDFSGYGMGIAVGDLDNDGWVDVYISQYEGGRLFRNRGDGTFVDVTASAGVALPQWGTSCCFCDYNRDGWLDLVVVNYVDYDPSDTCTVGSGRADFCPPNHFKGTASRLFRNRGCGRDGHWLGFTDVSVESGLAARPSNGLGIVCADFDGDGWPDIFIANDARPNHLWMNNRDGTFREQAVLRGVAYDGAGHALADMGVTLADLDNDGRLDLFVTHLTSELPTLWRQDGPGQFRDVTTAAGLARPRWRGTGFGTIALDFNHDGHTDIAVVNGRIARARVNSPNIRPDLPAFWHDYAERNQVFANLGGGQFRDVSLSNPAFCGSAEVARGLAWADLDNDGAMDLITTSIEGPARLFKNIAPKAGHWLIVRTYDPVLKRDLPGTIVTIRHGTTKRVALANPGQSYCSSGDPRAHFGLGSIHSIDEILVNWPDGSRETFTGGPVDRVITVNKGSGKKS
jgi:hypothetical protein